MLLEVLLDHFLNSGLDALVETTKGSSGSTCLSTGEDNKRALTAEKALAHSGVQTKVVFPLAKYKGAATSEK